MRHALGLLRLHLLGKPPRELAVCGGHLCLQALGELAAEPLHLARELVARLLELLLEAADRGVALLEQLVGRLGGEPRALRILVGFPAAPPLGEARGDERLPNARLVRVEG